MYFYLFKYKMTTLCVPLDRVDVKADILDGIAKVQITCKFHNSNSFVISPIHYFSLDTNAIINNLNMKVDERYFTSLIKERTHAKQAYMTAVSDGKKASIIEKLSDSEYKLQLGNVNPYENVDISVEYVSVLDCNSNGSYIFVFPTNISTKYFSVSSNQTDKSFANDLSKLTYSSDIPYHYTFNIKWESVNNILGFEAPSHLCEIEHCGNKLIIVSNGNPSKGDFSIAVKTDHKPRVYYYEDTKSDEIYILATLKVDKPEVLPETRLKKDFRIIVDCSGSMDGRFLTCSKMEATKSAILHFLDLLNLDDYFNITFFGSNFSDMLQKSIKVTKESIFFAKEIVKRIGADMGGTELFDCLENSILNMENVDNVDCEKIIVLFTDGQIGNYTSLTNAVEKYYNFCNDFSLALSKSITNPEELAHKLINNRFRIFTIGIGNDVDRKLIKKLAYITGALYLHAKDSARMESALQYLMSNINAKYYLEARLEGIDNRAGINVYPNKNYVFLRKISQSQKTELEKSGLTLLCTNSKTNAPVKLNLKFDKFVKRNDTLKQMYYNIFIKELEHQLEFSELDYTEHLSKKQELIEISVKENIMSKYTSFLIVDDIQTVHHDQSIDVSIPHYSNTHIQIQPQISNIRLEEEVDTLDGGMDMFGGYYSPAYSTGEKDFVPYKTEIERDDILVGLCNLDSNKLMFVDHIKICCKNLEDLNIFASKNNLDVVSYYNIVMYFKMSEHKDLINHAHHFLCSIIEFNKSITPFKMLKTWYEYKKYITELIKENNRRTYQYYSKRGGGDY